MTGNSERLSRARRELVFARSRGVCQRPECDNPITLETFHAAHLRARANGGVIDDSNLEAWCSRCNLTTGARDVRDPRLMPRVWQTTALDPIVTRIIQSGAATVSAAPGAGKTVFAALVFEHLWNAGFVDRMIVFVPNRHLVDQWVGALYTSRQIQLKPNSAIQRPGQVGVVVTYQSLNNPDALATHLSQSPHRTLLVLDEVHHVAERPNGELPTWARNIGELAGDIASHQLGVAGVLNLSGTLWRSAPGERISTVRYRQLGDARLESMVDFEVTVDELVSRGELRPIDLYRLGAQVRLADYQNLEHLEGDLSDLDERPARAALASLGSISEWRTAFVSAVLDRLQSAHEALDGHHVKALIVAARQDHARAFHEEVNLQMTQRGLRPLSALAISDEQDAPQTLEHFRRQKGVGVLCTVNMTGEGYDCPDIAVVGYASNKLTSLYVRQVSARAMRVTDRERELGFVIPAAIVLPDESTLVEQLVSYLAPFTHEVLVPKPEQLALLRPQILEQSGDTPRILEQRYVLEDAQPESSETVTVPYADGSREDVDGDVVRGLAVELQRANVPAIYAPRVIAASRRTVGDLLASRPFERLGTDASTLERLAMGAAAVKQAEVNRSASVEEKTSLINDQLVRWGRWWQINGDSPASHFHHEVNEAAGIADGDRDTAAIGRLELARKFARERITRYCARTGKRPPRGLGPQ